MTPPTSTGRGATARTAANAIGAGWAQNVDDWERVASVAAGTGLLVAGLRAHGTTRALAGLAGAVLVARGAAGYCPVNAATGRERRLDDTRRALGGSHGVHVQESVTIQAPASRLFEFWSNVANLPEMLPFLTEVEPLGQGRSHWVVEGPGGMRVEWDAEVVNEVRDETIGWRSLPGADVASAGSVRFRALARGGTQVTVTLQYEPPAGHVGASVARAFGSSPASRIREALRQFKATIETGEVPTTDGQPAGERSRLYLAAAKGSAA